ncbi:MAG: hypothetical protein IT560_10390 [Alphaproteobacteria bacterium]|nr:hypothetical protein [Alphaproteobacteria bacterium]
MAGTAAKSFQDKAAPPPVMAAGEYLAALEKLLAEGKGFGKTEPVAAYLLRDLMLMDEASNAQAVKIQQLYIVMDITQWPNEYGRSLVMQDIAVQYAKRVVGENDINAADFKGPGLWTAKKSSFEGDYIRRAGSNEYGRPNNVWEPDPQAFRLALAFNKAATIPTQWGTWTIEAGGTLAVREKDIPALAEALQAVRDGRATAESALYTVGKDGTPVAKFDVYGMAPEFLEDNYKPVNLSEATHKTMRAFKAPKR